VKSSPLMQPTASLATDRLISTVVWIHPLRSRSGLATLLTVRISAGVILTMVGLNRSFKVANLGVAGGGNDATIHFLHRHDRQSTWPQPAGWMAV
jgi:hypothetical protein